VAPQCGLLQHLCVNLLKMLPRQGPRAWDHCLLGAKLSRKAMSLRSKWRELNKRKIASEFGGRK
jgi:hypothetical protein